MQIKYLETWMRYVAGIYRRLDIYRSDNFSFIEQIKLGRYPVLLRKCGHTCCACYSMAIALVPWGAARRRRGRSPSRSRPEAAGPKPQPEPPGGGGAEAPAGRLRQSPAGARKSTFILTPQRGGGVKVLLRYFLTEKVTKRSCPPAGAMVRWDW